MKSFETVQEVPDAKNELSPEERDSRIAAAVQQLRSEVIEARRLRKESEPPVETMSEEKFLRTVKTMLLERYTGMNPTDEAEYQKHFEMFEAVGNQYPDEEIQRIMKESMPGSTVYN